jgi:hypothetical protein
MSTDGHGFLEDVGRLIVFISFLLSYLLIYVDFPELGVYGICAF